ncbi:MAG: tetratricopeptide repeat protein [Alphaproteobacteria bacterium]
MTAGLNRAERRKAEKLQRTDVRGRPESKGGTVTVSLRDILTKAVKQHENGNLDVAEPAYRQILAQYPNQQDALQFLGVLLHQKGESEEGIALLRKAAELAPDNGDIVGNLGSVLIQSKRVKEGEAALRRALELQPQNVNVRVNLIRLLADLKRIHDALLVCREGIALLPRATLLYKYVGEILVQQHDYTGAAKAFATCIEIDGNDADAMNDLAVCQRELGNFDEAEKLYRRAVKIAPDMIQVRYNLAAFLSSVGRVDEAKEHLDRVLAANPDHWMTITALALNLAAMGREDEAMKMLHRVAEAHPDDAIVWNDVGAQFMRMGRFDEARAMFARSVELDPNRVEPQTNLGNAYMKQGFGLDAIREYEKALKLRPMHLEAHVALCRILKEVYRLDEANIYAHATINLDGYGPKYFSNPLQVFRATCDFAGLEELGDIWKIIESIRPEDLTTALLQLVVYAEDRESTKRLAGLTRRWGREMEQKAEKSPLPARPRRAPNPKIRIGILSSDLRYHSVSRFMLPLATRYDRDRFEMYCYSPVRMDNDIVQKQYRASVDKFTFVTNLTDRQVAEVIRADDIDILIELNGFTQGSRLPAIAFRPAPVQISWLGYPFTSALKDMDYVLVDEYLKPEEDTGLVESPLVMKGSWVCFGEGLLFDPVDIDPVPPADRNGFVTFGTLNNTYKYTPGAIALWAEVMKRVPDSRFLIVRPECGSLVACRNIAEEFAKNAVSPDRLYYINNRNQKLPHLAYYNEIDLSLDTFPITGGTTTTEALWMGVPVVTLYGPTLHQRISYALLRHCGLEECCAQTKAEYVEKAVALASDVTRLRALKAGLRGRLQASPLARPDLFVENFQATMTEVAAKHGLR